MRVNSLWLSKWNALIFHSRHFMISFLIQFQVTVFWTNPVVWLFAFITIESSIIITSMMKIFITLVTSYHIICSISYSICEYFLWYIIFFIIFLHCQDNSLHPSCLDHPLPTKNSLGVHTLFFIWTLASSMGSRNSLYRIINLHFKIANVHIPYLF